MTDQRAQSCTLCMLIPLVLGLAGLLFLYWMARESKAEFIENDLGIKSEALLSEQQVGGVIVNMDGRDAILTGSVESEQRSHEIETIIASLSGIRMIDNQLEIASLPISEPEVKLEADPAPIEEPEPEIVVETEVALAPEEPEPESIEELEPEVALAPEVSKPAQEEIVEEILQTLDLSGITFLFGSNEISPEGTAVLNDVANILNEHSQFDVTIEGHTDNVGDEEMNLNLSQQRVLSIINYLISQGISTERLNAIGYGESKPIASNDTPEGRATNRRIDFEVTRRP